MNLPPNGEDGESAASTAGRGAQRRITYSPRNRRILVTNAPMNNRSNNRLRRPVRGNDMQDRQRQVIQSATPLVPPDARGLREMDLDGNETSVDRNDPASSRQRSVQAMRSLGPPARGRIGAILAALLQEPISQSPENAYGSATDRSSYEILEDLIRGTEEGSTSSTSNESLGSNGGDTTDGRAGASQPQRPGYLNIMRSLMRLQGLGGPGMDGNTTSGLRGGVGRGGYVRSFLPAWDSPLNLIRPDNAQQDLQSTTRTSSRPGNQDDGFVETHAMLQRPPTGLTTPWLNLEVVDLDGGEYGLAYGVGNLLRCDTSVYCTKQPKNANILFRHQRLYPRNRTPYPQTTPITVPFVMTHVVIKVPATGYTAPVKDGLVFVSHGPMSFDACAKFNDFTKAKYETFLQENKRLSRTLLDTDPVQYFQIGSKMPSHRARSSREKHVVEIEMDRPKAGTHVLVKFLRSQNETAENIDVEFFGVRGYYGKRSFPQGYLL